MTNLAIAGITGRMGQAVLKEVQELENVSVTAALACSGSSYINKDAALSTESDPVGVRITGSGGAPAFDVLVDFSTPAASAAYLDMCIQRNRAIVIGTTGLDELQQQKIMSASKQIPVLFASNTSIGINLCAVLVEAASRVLGNLVDIEIVESHHRHKIDAPSGTALFLGEAAMRVLGKDLNKDGVFQRVGQIGERKQGTIGFSTIRGGDIIGEHTVMFIGESERLEITHRATDRKIFAKGAITAAQWLFKRKKGLYSMKDVLELN